MVRKIKLEDPEHLTSWNHRGGWGNVLDNLKELVTPDGTLCISAMEEVVLHKRVITEPWIGFVHHVPQSNLPNYPDLQRLLVSEYFIKSLPHCQGFFTISHIPQQYLQERLPIPVAKVCYTLTPFPNEKLFSWPTFSETKRIINVGTFLRNFQSIFDLKVPKEYKKILLQPPDVNFDELYDLNKTKITLKKNDSVEVISKRLPDKKYDDLLSSSVVFLHLYDATINTTVIECIGRNTPLLVNRLPGIEEYLGKDYPLFYDTLDDAAALLNDAKLIEGMKYLQSLAIKEELTKESFLSAFTNTAIYRLLPLPVSQRCSPQHFQLYDLTVVTCSYKRVYNLHHMLECFEKQDYTGTFEIIIWNNNHETQKVVADITKPFMKELNIQLIQSSENYYCVVRMAVTKLMRSNYLLVCDDDIVPHTNFISTFMSKYEQYGPNAVLCCRGQVFAPHKLNEEQPEKFWENPNDGYYKKFYDEHQPDRQVITSCMSSSSLFFFFS